jgi:pimeloyl-ACP methyl ester carboxylesterase
MKTSKSPLPVLSIPCKLIAVAIAGYASIATGAHIPSHYDDGGTHIISGTEVSVDVNDSVGGDPTTVIFVCGANITGSTGVFDTSSMQFLAGSTLSGIHSASNSSDITIFGGTFTRSSILSRDSSTITIVDGSFDCSSNGGNNCIRADDTSQIDIFGGVFSGANLNGAITSSIGTAEINVYGGNFTERLWAVRGAMNIFGGSFDLVGAQGDGTTTIFGSSFTVAGIENFTGVVPAGIAAVSGTLSDGVFREFTVRNLTSAGQVIIAGPQAIPDPPIPPVGVSVTEIETLDPNPDLRHVLFSGGSPPSSLYTTLAGGVASVLGLAADGVTPVLLRWEVPEAGAVTFAASEGGLIDVEAACLPAPGSACAVAPATSLTVSTHQHSDGRYFAYALMIAPDDFARTASDHDDATRPIDITADWSPTSCSGSIPAVSDFHTLTLYRPPVMFLHGVWSNDQTWVYAIENDSRFVVHTEDYESTNSWRLVANLGEPRAGVATALNKLRTQGIAATRADVIGHSMGGLLSRLYISEYRNADYFRNDNFQVGDIHKLITLDTPHKGTELANLLIDEYGVPTAYGAIATGAGIFLDMCVICGSVADMRMGSDVMLEMPAAVVPAHAIVGVGGSDVLTLSGIALDAVDSDLVTLINTFDELSFGSQQHDLIVPEISQQGRLTDLGAIETFGYVPLFTFGVHVTVTGESRINDHIIDLLNAQVSSSSFASEFPAAPPEDATQPLPPTPTARPDDILVGSLQITSPTPGAIVAPGDGIVVTVVGANGFVPARIAVMSSVQSIAIDQPPFTTTLVIPADALGGIELIAFGEDGQGAIAQSTPVSVSISTSAQLLSMTVSPQPVELYDFSPRQQLSVTGSFDDAIDRNIANSALGTTYVIGDPAVAIVNANGLITAQGQGQTIVTVSNGVLNEVIMIEVNDPITNSDTDTLPDAIDNCTLTNNEVQRDTDGDGYGNICDADFTQDGNVNGFDLGYFKSVFFSSDPDGDLNGDGSVNGFDLGIFKGLYFKPPGPSGLDP